jgi:hypothetical protein
MQIITASAVWKYGNGRRRHENLDLHWCYSVLYDKIIHENKDMKNKIRRTIHIQLNRELKIDICSTKWRKPECKVLEEEYRENVSCVLEENIQWSFIAWAWDILWQIATPVIRGSFAGCTLVYNKWYT